MSRSAAALRIGIGTIVVVLAVVIGTIIVTGDDDGPPATSTTSTSLATSSSTSTTTAVEEVLALWPYEGMPPIFDPVEVVRTFGDAYLHFTNPIAGSFQQGPRSGTGSVDLRATSQGPVSSVQLLQRTDGGWVVTGSTTANIDLDSPEAEQTVSSPVRLQGQALAFEGTVVVEIRQSGSSELLGHGFVTGGGDVMRPFDGSIQFQEPTAPSGAIVLYTESAEDGSLGSAVVVGVRFS